MRFNKNGEICESDIYCWECSGEISNDITRYNKGELKGRMRFVEKVKDRLYGTHYRCLICNYDASYGQNYTRQWEIKDD